MKNSSRKTAGRTRLLRWIAMVLIGSLAMLACGNDAADLPSNEAVNIRFSNDTGIDLDQIWLGGNAAETGATFQTRYAGVADGEVTDYLPIEPLVINYDRVNATGGGERLDNRQLDPHEFLGVSELTTGSFYTLTLTNDGSDQLILAGVSIDEP